MVYDMLLPSIPVLLGYLLTYIIYRKGLIRKSLYVNIWNFILLLVFAVSALAGFVLLILLDMGITVPISPQLTLSARWIWNNSNNCHIIPFTHPLEDI